MNTMSDLPFTTRYNKNQLLFIDEQEITLIDYLSKLRTSKKITKKKISNMIKHNDYWYSQIERNGKNGDDNRQKTIYRNDLIDIISIVLYNASSSADLKKFSAQSKYYIDNVIKVVPYKESGRTPNWYKVFQGRTDEERERLLSSIINTQSELLRKTYDSLAELDRDAFLNSLLNMNKCLRIDPIFIIALVGLPYMDFLYEAQHQQIEELLTKLMKKIQTLQEDANNGSFLTKQAYYCELKQTILDYMKKNQYSGLEMQMSQFETNCSENKI